MSKSKKHLFIPIILLILLILILCGFYLRYNNLGEINFQNDEYFHLDAGVGFIKTGEFVLWDFLAEESVKEYTRAFPYTWIVASTFSIFEINEFYGRLPSLIFGLLLLPLLYFISFRVSKNHLISLSVLALGVFDSLLIWSSRLSRMYSLFVLLFLIACYLIYLGFEKNKQKINYYYLGAGGIVLFFSYLVHESALLIGLGLFLYFIINSIRELVKKNKKPNKYYISSLIMFILLTGAGIIHFFIHPLVISDYIALRSAPNYEYLLNSVNQLRIYYFAWIILLTGLIFSIIKWQKIKLYFYSLFIPVLLFFTFFAGRYPAKKYILFIIPFILILYADSIYEIIKLIFKKQKKQIILGIFIILFLLIGPIYSWPGVDENLVFQKARADINYEQDEVHNFRDAYKYIEDKYKFGEPILIQGAHTYYFSNPDLELISLKKDKEFTKKEIKQIMENNISGWVVWPKYKDYHLKYKVKEYIQKNSKKIKKINHTNVHVYHWDNK
ncbi:MAG: glycosyltransferase family 39 protein [Patescibacteria group bacterium]